jgi:Lrp/AsnC family leucine-responsive transcriptional regulator
MNQSRYVTRQLDKIDRAILAALNINSRMTLSKLGKQIGLSSPSVRDRILKLTDTGAIRGYTIVADPKVFGLNVIAHVRIYPATGQITKVEQMLPETPEVVLAHRVTGTDCFVATVVVRDAEQLKAVMEPFQPYATIDTAIEQSSTVPRRLPRL